ncbi:MAG: 2-C-methyl-D-erythritol 2,4-cyclodiphosphate synthase [Candidatus Marinimicrobia bacterium]|nr:2-C-methyl-D-erythritol 2,4-cyclodiphosphate synthase [Candidatus Neomarinimicrobiota bacterium]
MNYRIGQGSDTHQLEVGTPLILGGVSIPFFKGSKGHSDGDVLLHALVDALLGALGLGDIGVHFPSTEKKWKDADSLVFLEHAYSLIKENGYRVQNVDSTILLQEPHISKYIPEMKNNLSKVLETDVSCISVKATTTDYLGFIGNGSGISATAIIMVREVDEC